MQIELNNIKKIKKLCFDIPEQGVWILTGLNGSGKTSLLAAIFRIRTQHAFQKYYRTSSLENRLDSYENSLVTYRINGTSVSYKYGGQRWRATPRTNANIFEDFPYPAIEYIDANAERIEPFSDEINLRRLADADAEICQFIQNVLSDNKWQNLKYVNTRRGRGSDAYLIPYRLRNQTYYFSEKSFSLGELCVFKLAKKINAVPDNSLLLIDELEMALHPQAQVRLVEEIKRTANRKQLTVIFSTHSSTIIKNTKRKNLIYLKDSGNGNIQTVKSAYPAQILGDVAFDDELTADFIFFVEDKEAKLLLEQIVGRYLSIQRPDRNYQPLYKIVPVGGYVQVIEMLRSASSIFPAYVKKYAFLDRDVETETLAEARRTRNQQVLDLFYNAPQGTNYLPFTPELGFIELIENNLNILAEIEALFQGHAIHLNRIITSPEYLAHNSNKPRERAKKRMSHVVDKINQITGTDKIHIRRHLYKSLTDQHYSTTPALLPQLLGPVFNAR